MVQRWRLQWLLGWAWLAPAAVWLVIVVMWVTKLLSLHPEWFKQW